jgi:hypothetical protein
VLPDHEQLLPPPETKTPAKDYHGQVDFFAVYCRETAGVYLIPITICRCTREPRCELTLLETINAVEFVRPRATRSAA